MASEARIAEARAAGVRTAEALTTGALSATAGAAGVPQAGLRMAEAAISTANAAMEARAAERRVAEARITAEARTAEAREAERFAAAARSAANPSASNINLAEARAAEARAAEALATAEARMAEVRAVEAQEAERRAAEAELAPLFPSAPPPIPSVPPTLLGESNSGNSGYTKPLLFSLGLGAYGGLDFLNTSYFDFLNTSYYEDTIGELALLGYFNAEFFKYGVFDVSLYYRYENKFDEDISGNAFGLSFSLFGQYPFIINKKTTLFPLAGIGFDMLFFDYYSGWGWHTREHLKDFDSFSLKFGGGINYGITEHFRFSSKLLYEILLYSEATSYYKKYSRHGPKIMLGISYVF